MIHSLDLNDSFLTDRILLVQWTSLPYPVQPGQVGGHEGVGRIVKLGVGSEKTGVKIGDRVGIKWISGTCGQCSK